MENLIMGVIFAGIFSVFNVQATVYYLDGSVKTAGDCSTEAKACINLSTVLSLPALAHGDEIRMAQGTYKLTAQQTIEKAVSIKGGYTSDFIKRTSDATSTIITSDGADNFDRLFSVDSGVDNWLTFDTLTLTGLSNAGTKSGAIQADTDGVWLALNNVVMKDNVMIGGSGAIEMRSDKDKLKITNSEFINNEGETANGGAVKTSGGSVEISDTIFIGNKAPSGGAVMLDANTTATIQNATFYANTVGGNTNITHSWGGAIANNGSTLNLHYSTFYKNKSITGGTSRHAGALGVWGAGASTTLFGNLFLDNTASGAQSHIATQGVTLVDKGHNILGYAINSDVDNDDGLWTFAATAPHGANTAKQKGIFGEVVSTTNTLKDTHISTILVDIDGPKDNGGTTKSLMIVLDGPAMDAIGSTQADFFGRGNSSTYPFKSLQQAHSAMSVFADYEAGIYHFDLDGDTFTTYVTKEGWVLVASGDTNSSDSDTSTETVNLSPGTDSILNETFIQHAAFDFDEVRISTPEASTVALGMTKDDVVTKGNSTAETENMDLWVRSSSDFCDGTKVSTDGRGLPRSNFINPADVNQADDSKACDIGAFEYNNGYQLDCYDEDGMRHENNYDLSGTGQIDVNVCFGGDFSNATPKALLDNIGAIHPVFYLFLLSILGLRLRRK